MFARKMLAFLTEYNDQTPAPEGDEFVIPEDLSALSDGDLTELHAKAVESFDAVYGDGEGLDEAALDALAAITEGVEALKAELHQRAELSADRKARAAELASKVREPEAETSDMEDEDGAEDDEDEETPDAPEEEDAAETVVASGRKEVRVNLSRLNSRRLPRQETPSGEFSSMTDVLRAAGEGTGFAPGQGLRWGDVGKIVNKRLDGFNLATYRAAAAAGRHMRQQFNVATIHRPIPADLQIMSNDPTHVDDVLARAASEARLPQGSLTASGGWCAPSETLYDLLELESRDGIYSLPEVGFARGGINRTLGPDFSDLYTNIVGFSYTEAEDIAGDYDGAGGGSKPCYHIDCPTFEEFRLTLDGLCLTAGLLQQRGYPEYIARTVRGALVAHDHRMASKRLTAVVAGSDAVTMPAKPGATAPLLDAIELQVEQLRTRTRISRSATMEAVFPYWVRGAIRSDLARRDGVDVFSISDAQISAWFTLRGIAPQFVYNLDDLPTATTDVFWPTSVTFLVYPAGAWVQGAADVITIDTLYDSVMLGTNDYTALFTEEGWAVVKMSHESRAVTVPLSMDGSIGAAVELEADATETPAV